MQEYNLSFEELKKIWGNFSREIYNLLKDLRKDKVKLDIELKRLDTLKKIISESKNNTEFMIKHKNAFLEIDSSLDKVFSALDQFMNLNALDNSVVPELVKQVLNDSFNEKVDGLFLDIKDKQEKLSDRISDLEELRTSRSFDDKLIVELLEGFSFNKMECRMIRLYPLLVASKKKERSVTKSKKIEIVPVEDTNVVDVPIDTPIIEPIEVNDYVEDEDEDLDDTMDYVEDEIYRLSNKMGRVHNNNSSTHLTDKFKKLKQQFNSSKDRFTYYINLYQLKVKKLNSKDIGDLREKIENNMIEDRLELINSKIIILVYSLIKDINYTESVIKRNYDGIKEEDLFLIANNINNINTVGDRIKELEKELYKEISGDNLQINDSTNDVETKEAVEEPIIEEIKEEPAQIPVLDDNTVDNETLFNEYKNNYNNILNKYNDLLDKYYNITNDMKPHEKAYYLAFSQIKKLEDLTNYIDEGVNQNDVFSKITAFRVFDIKKEIDETIEMIISEEYKDITDIEYLNERINDFDRMCNNLVDLDELLKSIHTEVPEIDDSFYVYFLIDEDNKIISFDDVNKVPVYKKLSSFNEVDNILKKDPFFVKETDEFIGRTSILQRINNDKAIGFVKVKVENGTKNGILIINCDSISKDGYSGIQKSTIKLAKKMGNIISEQIDLIEKGDSDYLSTQSRLREQILNDEYDYGGNRI